ncbi:hypothetical protein B0T25DRAFT_548982 [Lasiosphaeria hispida]|uniref:Secreted protein n=1 Tax=Lasiosphaeria hispida TaxID=260671 RepID=A0AAJ0HFF3_9PEZI|nr:hypothetical protein B0T25DRAFT_548982 [Lasiosphaeria hispida]
MTMALGSFSCTISLALHAQTNAASASEADAGAAGPADCAESFRGAGNCTELVFVCSISCLIQTLRRDVVGTLSWQWEQCIYGRVVESICRTFMTLRTREELRTRCSRADEV